VRLGLPFVLCLTFSLTFNAAAASSAEDVASLSRQLDLYYALQQRIAQPGEISEEGLSGLKLLLAQLYTEMGMLLAAEHTLNELQGGPSIQQLRDMGRLMLARQYRMRGEVESSQAQLDAIGGKLDTMLENERLQMIALSALEQGDRDEALKRFGEVQGGERAMLLARFNYAALLLQGANQEHGLILLQELAAHTSNAPAVSALKDRANLLLGYFFLRRGHNEEAITFLRKIRLHGPYSRAALLAQGWAELSLRGPEYAMAPWMELLAAGEGDNLSEEAALAIASAISIKGPTQRAVEHYDQLIKRYEAEREQVKRELHRHRQPYPQERVETYLDEQMGGDDGYKSVPAVALRRLFVLKRELSSGRHQNRIKSDDDKSYFEQLWGVLHALYPRTDEWSGVGISSLIAQGTEQYITNFNQSVSGRSLHIDSVVEQRVEEDRQTLDGEITVVAEWYRRTRLTHLQERDVRLVSYLERARLGVARNHDLALSQQESD